MGESAMRTVRNAASAQSLTSAEFAAQFVGKTFLVSSDDRPPLEVSFAADGTITMSAPIQQKGSWRPNDMGYCSKWPQGRTEESCFIVIRRLDGAYDFINQTANVIAVARPK